MKEFDGWLWYFRFIFYGSLVQSSEHCHVRACAVFCLLTKHDLIFRLSMIKDHNVIVDTGLFLCKAGSLKVNLIGTKLILIFNSKQKRC